MLFHFTYMPSRNILVFKLLIICSVKKKRGIKAVKPDRRKYTPTFNLLLILSIYISKIYIIHKVINDSNSVIKFCKENGPIHSLSSRYTQTSKEKH